MPKQKKRVARKKESKNVSKKQRKKQSRTVSAKKARAVHRTTVKAVPAPVPVKKVAPEDDESEGRTVLDDEYEKEDYNFSTVDDEEDEDVTDGGKDDNKDDAGDVDDEL